MEGIIGLGIVFYVSMIMIGIGVAQLKSKNPVGFYTGQTPPKSEDITDVKAWNHKHGIMWILYGVALLVTYFIGFIGIHLSELIFSIILITVSIGGVIIMCIYHSRLQVKYLKK